MPKTYTADFLTKKLVGSAVKNDTKGILAGKIGSFISPVTLDSSAITAKKSKKFELAGETVFKEWSANRKQEVNRSICLCIVK